MADVNLQMTQRNAENTDWDNLNPITKAANVKMADGTTVEVKVNEHKADFTQQIPYAVTAGSANTYTASTNPALPSLVAGVAITVKINVANTGVSTLNWNGKGAKAIKKANGNDVASGNLKLNGVYTLRYDGTSFILQGEGGEYGTAPPDKVSVGYTIATEDSGTQSGTFTADATATAPDIVSGKTAYVNGVEVTGTRVSYAAGDRIPATAIPTPDSSTLVTRKPFDFNTLMGMAGGSDGCFYVSSAKPAGGLVTKYNKDLDVEWEYTTTYVSDSGYTGIRVLANGNVIAALGNVIVCVNPNGGLVWTYTLPALVYITKLIFERNNGEILLWINYNAASVRLYVLNANGTLRTSKTVESAYNVQMAGVAVYVPQHDSIYYAEGSSSSYVRRQDIASMGAYTRFSLTYAYDPIQYLDTDGMYLYAVSNDIATQFTINVTAESFTKVWIYNSGRTKDTIGFCIGGENVYYASDASEVIGISKTSGLQVLNSNSKGTDQGSPCNPNKLAIVESNGIRDLIVGYVLSGAGVGYLLSDHYSPIQ